MAKMKFRVLAGRHVGPNGEAYYRQYKKDASGKLLTGEAGELLTEPGPNGDIVETDVDLCAKFNKPGFPPKFARVEEDAWLAAPPEKPPTGKNRKKPSSQDQGLSPDDEFDSMTEQELREFAGQNDIDVKKLRSKSAIIERLRAELAAS